MDKTKIYIVTKSNTYSLMGLESIVGFFLSKEDAEYWVYSRDKSISGLDYFAVREAIGISVDKNEKEFQRFIESKLTKIQESIDKSLSEINKNNEDFQELHKRKSYYESLRTPEKNNK